MLTRGTVFAGTCESILHTQTNRRTHKQTRTSKHRHDIQGPSRELSRHGLLFSRVSLIWRQNRTHNNAVKRYISNYHNGVPDIQYYTLQEQYTTLHATYESILRSYRTLAIGDDFVQNLFRLLLLVVCLSGEFV